MNKSANDIPEKLAGNIFSKLFNFTSHHEYKGDEWSLMPDKISIWVQYLGLYGKWVYMENAYMGKKK